MNRSLPAAAGGVSLAFVTIATWALSTYAHVELPGEVVAALTTVITTVTHLCAAYLAKKGLEPTP